MKKNIVILGGGGHAKVVIDAIKRAGRFKIYGVVDASLSKDKSVLGVKVLGDDSILPGLFKKGVKFAFIGIGSIGNCSLRKRLYHELTEIGFKLPTIIHPKAVVASDVKTGDGTFIAAGAIVNPGTKIGKNVIINTRSSVDHDCVIGDFVHIAPGVTLSGSVNIDDETHIGTGASVIQGIKIGKNCVVGAGVTVRYDVTNDRKHFGATIVEANAKE